VSITRSLQLRNTAIHADTATEVVNIYVRYSISHLFALHQSSSLLLTVVVLACHIVLYQMVKVFMDLNSAAGKGMFSKADKEQLFRYNY
jgi:hypothetical protein